MPSGATPTGHRSLVSTGACLVLIISYLNIQVVAGSQAGYRLTGAVTSVRGIFRFASTNWDTLAGDGFNWVTDGGINTNNYAGQKATGLTGIVYLNAYNNSTCLQTMTDAQIAQVVQTNINGGNAGAVYQVGDEPTTNGCNANPSYTHMTAVIHVTDPTAKSWVADDQFNDPATSHWPAGLPMKGSVDILAFDIYPCQAGPCQYNMIDLAIQRIHFVGLGNWEFILQDFGPCESWRAPTAQELTNEFEHWQGAGALGYWVYAYDSDPTPCPGNVAGSAVLRQINAMSVNPAQPTTSPVAQGSPAGRPSPATSATTNSSPSPVPTRIASGATSPTVRVGSHPTLEAFSLFGLSPLALTGIGLLMALVVIGLNYFRRRIK